MASGNAKAIMHLITLVTVWPRCKDIAEEYERSHTASRAFEIFGKWTWTLLKDTFSFIYLWCFCSMVTLPSDPSSFWSGHTPAWTEASSSIWIQMNEIKCNTGLTVDQDLSVKSHTRAVYSIQNHIWVMMKKKILKGSTSFKMLAIFFFLNVMN